MKKIFYLTIESLLLLILFVGIIIFISNNLNKTDKIDKITKNFLTFAYKENKSDQIQLRTVNLMNSEENSTNSFEFKINNTSNKSKYYKILLHPKTKY